MRRILVTVLTVGAVALSGCGGDDGDAVPEQSPTTAPIESPTAVEEADPEPTADARGEQRTYRVRRGDTLSAIAARFDTTVRALVRLNNIEDPNKIRAGRELKIPPAE